MGHRNQYTEDYKREAVARAKESGNISRTARELGINTKTLHEWIRQYSEPLDVSTASDHELTKRIRELEKRLAVREAQIEVLKKAIGIVSDREESGMR
mgnify:CR=1 FL=1